MCELFICSLTAVSSACGHAAAAAAVGVVVLKARRLQQRASPCLSNVPNIEKPRTDTSKESDPEFRFITEKVHDATVNP